jgi:hypothetical protein
VFTLNLAITNDAIQPVFDADLLSFCGARFDEQGNPAFYGLNSKSTYLRAQIGDHPAQPLKIALADLGAGPGDVLKLGTVGTYSDATILKDGNDTRLSAVFSSTNVVSSNENTRYRVPGAINAGSDVVTKTYWPCLFCFPQQSDISQDFRIDPTVNVTVPAGANFLIVAPLAPSQKWDDDSGFSFGVSVEVNP